MRRAVVVAVAVALSVAAMLPAHATLTENDPLYPLQWGLRKIRAPAAWRRSTGRGAVIAVIDTGVDSSHPDLKGRLLRGRDFADGNDDTNDDNGHGTLIAGIISADTANRAGVASVAPVAKILPVRVLGSDGTGSSQSVASGIDWASSQHADVINLSLAQQGGSGGGLAVSDSLLRDQRVDRAIKDAAAAGAVVVIAAGNNTAGGQPQTAYDSTTPGVLVVGATAPNDERAAYSNYGTGLDLVAPGGGSASDPSDAACTQDDAIVSTWWNPKKHQSSYGGGCGTSMAVGFVSGVAGLLAARGMSNVQIAHRILTTCDDIGAPGRDDQTGAGLIDAARALGVQVSAASTARRPSPAASKSPVVGAAGKRAITPVVEPPVATGTQPPHVEAIGPLSGSPTRGPDRRPALAVAAGLLGLALAGHGVRLGTRRRWT